MTRTTDLPAAARLCAAWLDPARPVLAAVSGGLDSMCLLHFLLAQGYSVSCAHFDHQLRGEASASDAAFVRLWCEQHAVPFYLGSGDVRAHARSSGESLESAARSLRYRFLRETARRLDAQLVLAHQQDDNAETVLLNLLRGTDLRGLCAMKPSQDGLVRPFLDTSRADLAAYAAAHGIPHVEDATNLDPSAAARNLLRLEVLPRLRALNPRASEHIAAAARSLSSLDEEVERDALALLSLASREGDALSLPLAPLRAAHPSVRSRVLLRMADELGLGRRDISRSQLDAILALLARDDRTVRRVSLPRGASVRLAAGFLTMTLSPAVPAGAPLLSGVPLRWGTYELTLLPRADDGSSGLSLRPLAEGETLRVARCRASAFLRLSGSNGARSVKRLCIDRRLPPERRDLLPALYVNDRLAAVWGLGVDEAFLPRASGPAVFVRIGELPPC